MLLKKEFYFIRHGQTDHNLLEGQEKGDHHGDVPLNQTGTMQALSAEPIVARLPIQTICVSPMKRAQQTKVLAASGLQVPHHDIENLGECSLKIWREMASLGMYSPLPLQGEARVFMDRVQDGINQALSLPGPALIIAHGGVHWALCCLMGIERYEWTIKNCEIAHFQIDDFGKWRASRLFSPQESIF